MCVWGSEIWEQKDRVRNRNDVKINMFQSGTEIGIILLKMTPCKMCLFGWIKIALNEYTHRKSDKSKVEWV